MKEIDFLRGRPAANLARFALPALGANLLQSADQVVDMLVVGAFVGERGVAALANATMVGFVANSLSLGLSVGATVLVSRRLGACDPRGASRAEGAALLAAIALSAAVALPCALLAGPLYGALGIPADALTDAAAYTRVWAAGLPGAFLLSAAGAVMRARGDARTPMWLAVAVAAVNCAGGVALVPALGVAGTAWSSTAASSLAAALSLAMLARRRGSALPACPRSRDLTALARVAAPAAFQQVVVNLSYLAITSMTNAFGTAVVAGAGAATKANTLAGMPVWSSGQAVSAAVARCEGAGDRRRALAYARAGLAVSVGATALVVLLVQASAPQVIGLFADDPDAVAAGVLYLRACCSANSLAYAAMYALDSFAQATGAPRLAAVNALLDAVVVRVGLAVLLVPALGYPGILAAQALSPVLPCAVGAAYLRRYARGARSGAGDGGRAAS
jgi:Na+-driven multidrug efflux pump